MRSTIRDVAREAGVSIATVSRVMRDGAGVRPDTRERVRRVAAELDFVPSALGRQLAERRHAANGIVFPDLSGPYYAEVVLGYEAVAGELGRSVLILATQGRPDAAAKVLEMADRCDGLVVLGGAVDDALVERLVERGTRLVLVARTPLDGVDAVVAENRDSAAALATHLVEVGVRTIRFVGDPELSSDVAERWTGLQAGLAGTPATAALSAPTEELDEGAGRSAARTALDDLPDAFVCANDELALGVLDELRARGIDVPHQVRVTGWDDVMAARYAGLTTVRQPMREVGATAARLLDELITGTRTTTRHELLPTELVVRSSTLGKDPR